MSRRGSFFHVSRVRWTITWKNVDYHAHAKTWIFISTVKRGLSVQPKTWRGLSWINNPH